jgi:FKBP-type peptidyl-prolyl cis-trans isomerase FkpA
MKKAFLLLATGIFLTACQPAENTDSNSQTIEPMNEEVEVAKEPTEDGKIRAYIAEKGWEAKRDASGVYVVIEDAGEGAERPSLKDEVTLYYKGYFMDGKEFDGTKGTPVVFGLRNLIPGWQIGIPYFGKGGKGKLIVPHKMGYGRNDFGPIPGESILVFDIEVLDWSPLK